MSREETGVRAPRCAVRPARADRVPFRRDVERTQRGVAVVHVARANADPAA